MRCLDPFLLLLALIPIGILSTNAAVLHRVYNDFLYYYLVVFGGISDNIFLFSSRRRHTRYIGDWSSDVCSSDLRGRSSSRISNPLRSTASRAASKPN